MAKSNTFLVFAALIAAGLLFSCAELDIDSEKDILSSSSETLYDYCVYPEAEECFGGSYSACLGGGVPSNECPYSSLPSSDSPSSSSFLAPSSSSSVGSPSSDSSGGGNADCADLSPGNIDFTCEWSGSFISGKKVTPTINVISGGENCTKNISLLASFGVANCKVFLNEGREYSTGAEDRLQTNCEREENKWYSWPVPTESKDEVLDVKASVKCGNYCKQIDCPLTITSSPKPNVSGEIKCDWPLLPNNGANKYLSIGADLPACDISSVTIANPGKDDANCGEVTYENSGSTSTAGKVYGRAVATCSGSKRTLKEYEAEVVPDPSLSGNCSWEKNPVKAANGATPSGVSLTNSYGRCGTLNDAALPATAYVAEGVSSWPIRVAGTYDVKTNISCMPEIEQKNCPKLEVINGADYMIECKGSLSSIDCRKTVNLKVDECVEIAVLGYTEQFFLPNLIMRCEANGNISSGNVSYTLAFNEKTLATISGSIYVSSQVSLGQIKLGDNDLGTLCLKSVSGTTEVKCDGPTM
jgi:hypothetical protein